MVEPSVSVTNGTTPSSEPGRWVPHGEIWSDEVGPAGAPLIVLVHGTMDRSTGMLKLSRRLDERFRVLRYDRRGYARSARTHQGRDGPFDMASQVGDLVSLLDGRRAIVVGHSYGGDVALTAAQERPDLVVGVAVYEIPLSWEPWWPRFTPGSAASTADAGPADAAELFMRRMIGDKAWEALPARTRETRRDEGRAMVSELADLRSHRPWSADRISCQLVLGYGSAAADHHRRGMRHVHDLFPGSSLVELEGARHDAPTSHSQLFAETIVDPLAVAVGGAWADASRADVA